MPKAHFILTDGTKRTIDVPVGWSLMESARQNGIPGIVAECGGGAMCATCHVHVATEWVAAAGTPGGTESALLELAAGRDDTSRLSCQIAMSPALDGIVVRIPDDGNANR